MSQSGTYGSGGGGGTPITTLVGDNGNTASGASVNILTNIFSLNPYFNGTFSFNGNGASNMSLLTWDGNENIGIGRSVFATGGPGGTIKNNTALGWQAGTALDGMGGPPSQNNVLIGFQAGLSLTACSDNVALGFTALTFATTGSFNIGIGSQAGIGYSGSESSNILLNSDGTIGDSNTLRIGNSTGAGNQQLNRAFICGIQGATPAANADVVSISGDQLGTTTITAGTGITVTAGLGTITIASSGAGISWVDVPGNSQTMVPNTGYVSDDNVLVTFTLPVLAAFGTIMWVNGNGTGGWTIHQNAGQSIVFGAVGATTVGVGGSLSSTNRYDTVQILCVVANTTWNVLTSVGNITIV